MTNEELLPLGFSFVVYLNPKGGSMSKEDPDAKFQSVSGLSVDIETEEFAEGGENRFKHKVPVRTKFPNLVLKRALLANSAIIEWCTKAIQEFEYSPQSVQIDLLNPEGKAIYTWNLVNVYPLKWNIDGFNAEESKIVIETIELSYNYFTMTATK